MFTEIYGKMDSYMHFFYAKYEFLQRETAYRSIKRTISKNCYAFVLLKRVTFSILSKCIRYNIISRASYKRFNFKTANKVNQINSILSSNNNLNKIKQPGRKKSESQFTISYNRPR